MSSNRSIAREIGTALAVLAVYLLMLMAPLHQARASQLAFDAIGYANLNPDWSICSMLPDGAPDPGAPPAECPLAGLAKQALTPPFVFAPFVPYPLPLPSPIPGDAEYLHPVSTPPTGSRGPPVPV
jgi:hypothetical protein